VHNCSDVLHQSTQFGLYAEDIVKSCESIGAKLRELTVDGRINEQCWNPVDITLLRKSQMKLHSGAEGK